MKLAIQQKQINLALHILIWMAILLLPFYVSTAENDFRIGPVPGIVYTLADLVNLIIFYTNAYYLYPKLWNRRYWWLYILSSIAVIGLSFLLKNYIMQHWFSRMQIEESAYPFIYGPSFWIYIISIVYRRIIDRIKAEKVNKEREAQHLFTELKFLRSQISPHFLFNVLTNLVSLARKKSDLLEPSLIKLSDLMRYMLYDSQGKKVLLQKEIAYLMSYIELQKLRFGNSTRVESRFDTAEHNEMIEPMLLIPFVENAFKHGTGYVGQPHIRIDLRVDMGTLIFDVQNNFDRENDTSKDEHSGIGLANVKTRLALLYDKKHHLQMDDSNGIFHVTLTLMLN